MNLKTLNELDGGRVLELDEQPYEKWVKKHTYIQQASHLRFYCCLWTLIIATQTSLTNTVRL